MGGSEAFSERKDPGVAGMEGSQPGGPLRPLPSKRKGRGGKHKISPSAEELNGNYPALLNGNGHGQHHAAGNGHFHAASTQNGNREVVMHQRDVGQTPAVREIIAQPPPPPFEIFEQPPPPSFPPPPPFPPPPDHPQLPAPLLRVDSRKLQEPPPSYEVATIQHRGKAGLLTVDPPRNKASGIPLPTREEIRSFCRRTGGETGIYYENQNQFVPKTKYVNQAGSEVESRSVSSMKTVELFHTLQKRRRSGMEESTAAIEQAAPTNGKVMLKLRGELLGKGSGRVSDLTEVRVNLRFAGAGNVRLKLSPGEAYYHEHNEWHIGTNQQPDVYSVVVSKVRTETRAAAGGRKPGRAACSLNMMGQRLLNPNQTAPENPTMETWIDEQGMRCWFELVLELDMLKQEAAESRSSYDKDAERKKDAKKREKSKRASQDECGGCDWKRAGGTGCCSLLERLDMGVSSEVVVKYMERKGGPQGQEVAQEKAVRFHDLVWMEGPQDAAWMQPRNEGAWSSRSAESDAKQPRGSVSDVDDRVDEMQRFFQLPNTGWTCPPSSSISAGAMNWRPREEKSFSFVKVARLGGGGAKYSVNPHLLRFYIERVWGLKRPKLFVSVTGAAKDFDLPEGPRAKLLKGLQELGKIEGVWMATGGCSEGIMQFVGLARALMEVQVPLIGFATWGAIRGRGRMVRTPGDERSSAEETVNYKEVVVKDEHIYASGNANLDSNHSHFVLVSDGTADDFGKEFDVRAQLESVVAGTENRSEEILTMLKELKMGWKDMVVNNKEDSQSNDSIPLVLICVQGGPGTIGTCLSSTKNDVPLLLVKGSGKAADLIADAVMLKFKQGHVKYVPDTSMSKPMKMLLTYLKDFCEFREYVKTETKEHCVDYSEIIADIQARRRMGDHELEGDCINDIFKAYWGGERGLDDPLKTMSEILQIASSAKCWVFDLNDPDPGGIDFSGSLLRCIINNQGYEDEGVDIKAEKTPQVHLNEDMTLAASILYDKLMLAVHWDRKDIVELVLKNTRMRRFNRDFLQAIDGALHRAILLDKVAVVRALLEHGARIEQYQMTTDLRSWDFHHLDEEESPSNKPYKESYRAAELWSGLLRSYKVDKKTRHVFAFITAWQPANTRSGTHSAQQAIEDDGSDRFPRVVSDQSVRRTQSARSGMSFIKRRGDSFKVDIKKREAMSDMEWYLDLQREGLSYKALGDEMKRKTIKTRKTIPKMNALLGHVMGHDFRYQVGFKANAEHDLFLWSCLTNRVDLAMVFWEKYNRPVVSSLTASVLLRRMARRTEVDPVMRDKMRKSANLFEELAIGVQRAAQDLDLSQALEMLECPTIVWDRITCLDIAIKGRCEKFIEGCARSALDRRFAGDLEPYGQHLGPLQGFKRVVLVCFLTGGFIAPWVIKFALPPKAHCLRHPTQRRVMPEGYPYQPQKNQILNSIAKKFEDSTWTKAVRWLRLYREANSGKDGLEQKFGEEQLKELWHPTFTYWERLRCFWKSPVVLYMANATVQCLIAITETYFLTTHFVSDRAARADIQLLEWVWVSYTIASSSEELVHAIVDGIHTYCSDIWNAVDSFAALFFWIGFGIRMWCWNNLECGGPERDLTDMRFSDRTPTRGDLALQCYSVSLFCLWVRLLRILSADRKLGPLVLILRSMVADTLNFGVMWLVLWMAFSVFIFGSGINNDVDNNGCEDAEIPGACSTGWWVIRTFFQAMGEPILEEMTTMSSLIILMMLWVMMNLVLVNLLIAMMSNTFQAIQQKSERQWMIDLYQLVKESSRFALTVPAPFNLLWILNELFVFVRRLRDGSLDKLYGRISWRRKLRQHISRNMSTTRMLAERDCFAQEEKERQKLMSFMERARIKWREGQDNNGLVQDRLEGVEQRLYEVKKQMAKLHDRMAMGQQDMFGNSFGRRGSRASMADISPSPLTLETMAMLQRSSPVLAPQPVVGWGAGRPAQI